MHIAYVPTVEGNRIILNEEESKHCIQVLRMKVSESLIVVDGKGGYYEAQIDVAHPKKCELTILNFKNKFGKLPFELQIACAPTKNIERFEWFLEKATEIGIHQIIPIQCAHSERNIIKNERLQKVLISAMKQSLKAYLPELHELQNFKSFVESFKNFNGQKFIAHCHDAQKIDLQSVYQKGNNVLILIGPEGDFSMEEVVFALQHDFIAVSLSQSRLRTETAALVACCCINLMNES